MYYYLSFLRPPPSQVSLGAGSITVTPQIANDLRTERYPDACDLYYSWALETPALSAAHLPTQPRQIIRPMKLTTWRESNAYREIAIPIPQTVKEGQAYRLVLLAQQQGLPHVINFAAEGSTPYPVMSMPILFSSQGRRADTSKQEQVERIYRLPTGDKSQVFLSIVEQTSFDLDKKVWDSGLGLSAWLSSLVCKNGREESRDPSVHEQLRSVILSKKCDIIELGAGTGIVSLALGAIRSEVTEASGRILTTDLPSAMPLLERNISANERYFSSARTRPQPVVLDWDDERLPAEVDAAFDLIVMADVAYNTASFTSLIRTVDQILCLSDHSDGSINPVVLLGYKERDAAERSLWDMALSIGVELQKIGEKAGAGGCPVEIWVGQRARALSAS
ncbi:putative methyltransferase-domain-containing protein [Cytidiella melzeri]|nr:putative methyltransferase-domain-containing protein [Cytidiella melzeri]